MTKTEFLKSLKKELRTLKPAELQKNISYYEEIIADMMENGLSEEAAIAKIGTPKKIAAEILENTSPEMLRRKDRVGTILLCASAVTILLSVIFDIRRYFMLHTAISIIGGADGPTSIFLAGKIGVPRMWGVAAVVVLITVAYKLFRIWKEKRS